MSGARRSGPAIVVVNFGRVDLVEAGLADLDAAALDATVVLVDNLHSSTARAAAVRAASQHGWELVAPDANLGFGAGANVGVSQARALGHERFLLVNPDLFLDTAAARRLDDELRVRPGTLLSPVVLRADGTIWFAGGTLDERTGRTSTVAGPAGADTVPWLSGACLAVDAELWDRVGGFDESFFLYWEDVDLSLRVLRHGGSLAVVEEVRVVHAVGGTQGGSGKSSAYAYLNCRNRLLVAAGAPRGRRARWIAGAPGHAWRVVNRSGRRHLLRHPGLAWAAFRGTLDGCRSTVGRTTSSGSSRVGR